MKRRRFLCVAGLGTSAAVAGAFGLSALHREPLRKRAVSARHREVPPHDRINVGLIGYGQRGRFLIQQLPKNARIVAICDCDFRAAAAAADKFDWQVDAARDYRALLDRKDVDAVIVATGDFQRALPVIHACQAGKDVYAEKPLSLYVREGRAMVNAARKYGRMIQVGTQQRSMEMNRAASALVRGGRLGKVLEVVATNLPGPSPTPQKPGKELWDDLDWNMWLNQAALREFSGEWLAGWREFSDFSGGQMTDAGAHACDQIQCALGSDTTGPVEVKPLANSAVEMRYANGIPVRFVTPMGKGPLYGAVFVCEKGRLEISRNRFASNPKEIAADLLSTIKDAVAEQQKWDDPGGALARWHLQNWLDCIRSRTPPVADVEIGHRAVTLCHLANIARQVGRPLRWNPEREEFEGDSQANQRLERERRPGFELPTV